MLEHTIFQIDIHQVLRTKAPGLYKKIPDFLIDAFMKFICLDQLNAFLKENHGLTGVDLMEEFLKKLNVTFQVKGEENLPAPGTRCVFASNHPLGGLDGVCLSVLLGRRYDKHIRYLVNDILYFIEPLQNIFVPINKHGLQGKAAAIAVNESFASENQIITFPAGLCSRKIKKIVTDTEWKKMFITKSMEHNRDIVPVYFEAKNSKLFYRVANLRKKLHIKINIEMLLLPREMFKAGNSTFTIYIGKAIPRKTFDFSRTAQQWADWVKKEVYCTINNKPTLKNHGRNNLEN
ncbi:MAG: glycerol acyltransferase [Candidatus Symbiothrix sp.]|jgi:putative hemolysin|nr:glycerol acyltransferase [Candidatus Symbiothrix sp.]